MLRLVLLSGPLAVGKTVVANALVADHGFKHLRSSGYLKMILERRREPISREVLQIVGDRLDEETDYRWLIDKVAKPQVSNEPQQQLWLIDSVRKQRQVEHFQAEFGSATLHVHLWAPEEVLRERHQTRLDSGSHTEGGTRYDDAVAHPNEQSSRALRDVSDLSINVAMISGARAASIIRAAL
jgi:predicted kinase